MSGVVSIRAALETALAAMSPTLAPAYENVAFTPVAGTPYQRIELMFARPANDEISANYRQDGICQVTLCYPTAGSPGSGPAATRAELIRSAFKRGNSFTKDGIAVVVSDTPEVMAAYVDGDRFCIPVRIRFYAHLVAS